MVSHQLPILASGAATGSVRPDLPTSGSVRHQSCADMLKCVVADMKCAQRQHFTFTRTRKLLDSLEPNMSGNESFTGHQDEYDEHVMMLMDLETVWDEPMFHTKNVMLKKSHKNARTTYMTHKAFSKL